LVLTAATYSSLEVQRFNALTIAWTAKEDYHLCGDTKDGVVDEDTLSDEQNNEYVQVEEYVREWIKQIVDDNPDFPIGEIKIRTLNGLWQEFSAIMGGRKAKMKERD
jgi:hypothetical protein